MKRLMCVGIKTGNQLTLRYQYPTAMTVNLIARPAAPSRPYRHIRSVLAELVEVESSVPEELAFG